MQKKRGILPLECSTKRCLFNIFFHLTLYILHQDKITEDTLLGSDRIQLLQNNDQSYVIEKSISQCYQNDSWNPESNYDVRKSWAIKSYITDIIEKLCGSVHVCIVKNYSWSSANIISRSSVVPIGQHVIRESSFLSGSRDSRTFTSPGFTFALSVTR